MLKLAVVNGGFEVDFSVWMRQFADRTWASEQAETHLRHHLERPVTGDSVVKTLLSMPGYKLNENFPLTEDIGPVLTVDTTSHDNFIGDYQFTVVKLQEDQRDDELNLIVVWGVGWMSLAPEHVDVYEVIGDADYDLVCNLMEYDKAQAVCPNEHTWTSHDAVNWRGDGDSDWEAPWVEGDDLIKHGRAMCPNCGRRMTVTMWPVS